jgi:hypothetical protein
MTLVSMGLSEEYNNLTITGNAKKHLFLGQDMSPLSKHLRPLDKKQ